MFYRFKYCSNQFIRFRGPLHIFKRIENCNVLLWKAEKEQKQLKLQLNEITKQNPKDKSKDQ